MKKNFHKASNYVPPMLLRVIYVRVIYDLEHNSPYVELPDGQDIFVPLDGAEEALNKAIRKWADTYLLVNVNVAEEAKRRYKKKNA